MATGHFRLCQVRRFVCTMEMDFRVTDRRRHQLRLNPHRCSNILIRLDHATGHGSGLKHRPLVAKAATAILQLVLSLELTYVGSRVLVDE